ncbi:hypothetical protein [Paraliomyxa miuraensis]|uniref:hypothetical protein n=1 Tax=Paraliomyxa miuraensis TaxID=376150 RepID=UPI00225430FF|nr:hypothetical protein [Paraliomyxa miuraensis]MCX4246692.1 hypothetical protein [Paraliomyxa miuraensis]
MTHDKPYESCIVNSHNEWDPLEEVIVGVLGGACHPSWEMGFEATTPVEILERSRRLQLTHGGMAEAPEQEEIAERELEGFVAALEGAGVTVRRPDPFNHARPHVTPHWAISGGNCQANPRDVLIVLGEEILEAPMALRSRYFEFLAYRRLVKEYFRRGAGWATAPKPELSSRTYDAYFQRGRGYVTTDFEPVFDAADMSRFGRDVFIQRSHVTNDMGIDWLRRHLEPRGYRLHRIEFEDYRAEHIDATFVPLAPGKLMVNPERPIKELPKIFARSDWEIREAPLSTFPSTHPKHSSFRWFNMNLFSLDENRVFVEQNEEPMIEFLQNWGFEPIALPFRNVYRYGGSFHCATVDIRRRGTRQEYFHE